MMFAAKPYVWGATVASLGVLTGAVGGQSFALAEPPAATQPVDFKATDLLARAADRIKTTNSLTASYETITEYATAYKDTRETGTVTLERPNRLRIDTDRARRVRVGSPWEPTNNGSTTVTDGKTAWQLTRHPESAQYRTLPVTPDWLEKAVEPLPPIQGFWNQTVPPENVRYLGRRKQAGEDFEAVAVETNDEIRTVYLDATSAIRIVETIPRSGAKSTGRREPFIRRTVRVGPWLPLSAEDAAKRFAFTPPADATAVDAPRRAGTLLTVGALAPDFVAEDAAGKPVRLSDLTGKVVVLKFWATWCWPCRQSFPQTRQLAKEYGDKNVVVLAVAMWDNRKAFRNWVARDRADHAPTDTPALRFAFDPKPQGMDAASTLYGVSATPTEFVIGADGRITATFSGYDGPSDREALAVRAALSLPVAAVTK